MTGYQLVTVLIYINTDIYIEREIARDVDIDLIMEAQNHLGWEGPLRSLSATVNPALQDWISACKSILFI